MIYFVIVNYYSTSFVVDLIHSLQASEDTLYKIVIVNNSPEDLSINEISSEFPLTTILTAEKNLGFGAGCNLGIEYVYQKDPKAIIWLINPDTTIEPTATAYVRHCFMQESSLSILGTRIRDSDDKTWFDAGTFNPWLGSVKSLHKNINILNNQVKTIPCRWVSGCSFIINLSRFEHCPRFDPHYFLYYEDTDFCERYHKQGHSIAVTSAILVNHNVSAITGKNQYNKFRHSTYSKLYFLKQHGTYLSLGINLIYLLALTILLYFHDRPSALGRWQGIKSFLEISSVSESSFR
jgi:N-acetylglucosaminyl-diphospho-decaprenol L-rhamnosyltransferase